MRAKAVFAVFVVMLLYGCSEPPTMPPSAESREIVDNLLQAGVQSDEIAVVDDVVYAGSEEAVSLQDSRALAQPEAEPLTACVLQECEALCSRTGFCEARCDPDDVCRCRQRRPCP